MSRLEGVEMLNRAAQALTIDPNNLVIGIASIEVGGIGLGSLTDANLDVTTIVKERYVGYPAQRHETVVESMSAKVAFTAEEIGGTAVISLLDNLFNNLETSSSLKYLFTMYAPFATGDNLRLDAVAMLLPELSLDWQDDWSKIAFKFECVSNNAQSLFTKARVSGDRMPATTKNTNNLSIGKPKLTVNGIAVGALQSLNIALTGEVKQVQRSLPKCTSDLTYVSSNMNINVTLEEGTLQADEAASVLVEQALIDGRILCLEFPVCNITSDISLVSNNDWLGYKQKIMPYRLDDKLVKVYLK